MKLKVEKRYPFWISLLIGVGGYLFFYKIPISNKISDLFSALLNVSAIGIGFLGTSMGILYTMSKDWIIRALKDTEKNYYKITINYFLKAIYASSFMALMNCIGLLLDWNIKLNGNHQVIFSLWLSSCILSILTYQRIISIFSLILKFPKE